MVQALDRANVVASACLNRLNTVTKTTKYKLFLAAGAVIVIGADALYVCSDKAIPLAGMAINYVQSWSAPRARGIQEYNGSLPRFVRSRTVRWARSTIECAV